MYTSWRTLLCVQMSFVPVCWIHLSPPDLAHTLVSACHKRRHIRSYRLTTRYGLHQKTSFVSIRPHISAHPGDSSTQCPTLPSWPSIQSFTWQGLETSSWSSSCSLDRPTPQRHWICSCQPLETGHRTGPWWSHATARAGYAMTMTMTIDVCLLLQVVYKQDLLKQHTQMPIVLVQNLY